MRCPCGLHNDYDTCCGQYIDTAANAPTPEALMRSRYTAYSLAKIDYIHSTMKGTPRKGFSKKQAYEWASSVNWLGLEVLEAKEDTVSFKAHYELDGNQEILAEKSLFKQHNGKWFYIGQVE